MRDFGELIECESHKANTKPALFGVGKNLGLGISRFAERSEYVGHARRPTEGAVRLPIYLPLESGGHRQLPGAVQNLFSARDRGLNGFRRNLGGA